MFVPFNYCDDNHTNKSARKLERMESYPIEDLPRLGVKRKELYEETLAVFASENLKYGRMQGTTKTAKACQRGGMLNGLRGMHARVVWDQHMYNVIRCGDVGNSQTDPVFVGSTVENEAVINELLDGGRSRAQASRVFNRLCMSITDACRQMIKLRNVSEFHICDNWMTEHRNLSKWTMKQKAIR